MKNLIIPISLILLVEFSFGQTMGLQFDGVDDYAIVQHDNAYNIGYGNFTFEATVKLDPVQTAGNFPALLSTRSSGNDSGFLLFFFNGELSLQTDGQNHNSTPNGDIRDGQCHHVAVVRSSTSLLSWYIDGELTSTSTDANYNISTSAPMVIGNDFFSGSFTSAPFKGGIQEVRVWNVARTQSDIQSTMNASVVGNESGLIGYWRLDEGTGQIIEDLSPTNNSGVLGSTASVDVNDPVFSNGCPIGAAGTTGISDVSLNDNTFRIYPNPLISVSYIQIDTPLENGEVIIYDMLGKEVFREKIIETKLRIEKQYLESGAYVVLVRDNQNKFQQKLIVE